ISESLRNEKKQYLQHLKNQIDKIIECFENSLIQLQNYYINNPNLQNTTLSISDYYANIKNLIKKKRVLNENKSNIKIYEKIIEEIDKLPLNFLFTKNIEKILPLIEKNVFLKTEYQEIFKLENERMTLTQYQNEQNKNKINELTDTINKKRTQLKNGILLALKKELTDLLKENELFIFEINELEKKVKTTPNDHIRLSTLEKNVELTQQLYQNKIKEYISYEIGNIETPQIYVLQKPKYQSPYQSIYYQRNLSTFVIIFLIIAVAVSIILELFNQKIFEISELENYITEKNCEIIVLKKYKNKIENIEHLSVWLNMHTGKKMALLFDDCFAENIINDL
ncbi:MAG TPA: hypothetical protein PLM75_13900, partial [bacterium]|nr:hypothetical protein [bacterium]